MGHLVGYTTTRERGLYLMNLKPTHKAINSYHATLAQFGDQKIHHELAVRSAFQTLLADTARARKWMLVPELAARTRGRRNGCSLRVTSLGSTLTTQSPSPTSKTQDPQPARQQPLGSPATEAAH